MRIFAYLDPATGTLIVSAIVGAFAAVALVFKNFWYKIKGAVTRDGSDRVTAVEASTEDSKN